MSTKNAKQTKGSKAQAKAERKQEVKEVVAKREAQAEQAVPFAKACKAMVLAGHTDEEIWAALAEQYSMDEGRRWFVGWYRGDLVRKGLMSREEAKAHKHAPIPEHKCTLGQTPTGGGSNASGGGKNTAKAEGGSDKAKGRAHVATLSSRVAEMEVMLAALSARVG